MLTNGHTEARKLRSRLNHPIIDADGHWANSAPHAPGVPAHRRRHRGGGAGPGEPAHPCLARDVRGGAEPPPDRAGSVLVPADQEHARPGDRDAAAAHVRAARRSRSRLLRRLSHRRPRLPPRARSGSAARSVAPTTCSPPSSSGRSTTASSPPRSSRCIRRRRRSRSWSSRRSSSVTGGHDGRPHSPPDLRAGRGASRGLEVRRVVRRDRHRQPPRLRSGVADVPRAAHRAELPQRRALDPAPQLAVELLLQPHRPLRLGR